MPDKVTLSIPFATGVQDKASPVWLDAGGSTSVTNGIFVKSNQIQKRPGGAALSKTDAGGAFNAGNLTVTKKLAAYRNELLLFDGQYLRSYLEKLNQWVVKGETSPCVATREVIAQMSPAVYDGDVVECGGFRVYVWADAVGAYGALYFAVQDIANGLITSTGYVGNTSATASKPRLLQLSGTNVILVHQRSSDNALCGRVMAVNANPTWGGQTVIIAGAAVKGANVAWDAVAVTGASIFMMAYEDNAAVIKLKQVNSSLSVIATGTCTDASGAYDAITLRADVSSGLVWLGFSFNTSQNVRAAIYAYPALTESVAPFNVQTATGPSWGNNVGIEQLDSTHAIIVFGISTGDFQWAVISSAGAITLAKKQAWRQTLLSRPIVVNSLDSVYGVRAYCLVSKSSAGNQVTQFLVELDVRNAAGVYGANPVATVSPRCSFTSSFVPRSHGTLANGTILGSPSSTSFVTFGSVAESLNGVSAVSALTFDFNHPGAYSCAELGGSLYISGGVPCCYDGDRVAELGALQVNEATSIGAVAGGSLAASLTYGYVFVQEWRDYKGQKHQGQPSIPITATTTGVNKQVQITVTQSHLTKIINAFANPNVAIPYIVPYRTVATGGVMGTTYHRIITDSPAPFTGSVNPSNATFSFTDDGTGAFADTAAAAAEQLYTTGGVVESNCPPSFTTLCQHRGRIFGVADDQRTIWYSTVYQPGSPVRFFDGWTISVEEGGPITAIAGIEGYLVVFKADSIFYFVGDGENILDEQGGFQGPTRLPVDGGCINPRSLILTPLGLVFRTRNGMGLLDRGLGFRNDFADAVENTVGGNAAFPIVCATQHPTRPEYWFDVAASASAAETNGKSVVFNTRFGAWSVMSRYDTDKSRAGALFNSSAVVNGTFYYSTPFGQVYSEYPLLPAGTAGQFKDGGTGASNYVTMTVESAWLKPSLSEGAQRIGGFGRVWKALLQEEWRDYHDVTIAIAYDYSSTYTDTFTFAAGYHTSALYEELEVNMSRPLCEAVRLKFSDADSAINPSSTGQAGVLVGITAEIGVYPGTNRKGDARRK